MSDRDLQYHLARTTEEERRARTTDDPVIRKAHADFAIAYRGDVSASFLWPCPR